MFTQTNDQKHFNITMPFAAVKPVVLMNFKNLLYRC